MPGILGGLLLVLLLVGGPVHCAGPRNGGGDASQDCLQAAQARLSQAAAWECLPTLDGQCVPLEPLFDTCEALWPDCVLYPKFYLWESEVKAMTSHPPRGPVRHRIRLYHNILHTCRPAYRDPLRTHGDVAEFYDEGGRFMGLAVYMGQGLYCPLPAPGRRLMRDAP
jgi:hypothetical protein